MTRACTVSALAAATLLLAVHPAAADQVLHDAKMEPAVVIHLFERDHTPVADAHIEVYGPGDTDPFLVERTDVDGRVAFFPDRKGEWHIRALTEDGRDVDFTVDTRTLAGTVEIEAPEDTGPDRRAYTVLCIGLALGLFGAASLLHRRVSPDSKL